MWAVPTGPDGEELARAGGHDGSDYGTGFSPSAFGQHVTTSNALYPPSGTLGPLDFIRDVSTFSAAYSVFVKEPTKGAAKTIYVNFYRLVDQAGTPINHTNLVILNWAAGALSVTSSDASVSTSVDAIGSGWYRIKCVYTAALDTGAQDFDFLQVRTYVTGQGTGAVFKKVSEGGRGINFLKHADPLDVTRSDWTLANATTGTNSITNTTVAPPFYTATDGSYGFVTKLEKDPSIAFGTTPPAIIQSTTLNPGGIISTWNGERVNVTFYAKLDAANQANNTAIYVDLRSGTGTDGDGMLNGDGVRAVINASSSPWSLGVLSVIASSGTVANQSHAVTPVYQNSRLHALERPVLRALARHLHGRWRRGVRGPGARRRVGCQAPRSRDGSFLHRQRQVSPGCSLLGRDVREGRDERGHVHSRRHRPARPRHHSRGG
jgi:hypothetical protein